MNTCGIFLTIFLFLLSALAPANAFSLSPGCLKSQSTLTFLQTPEGPSVYFAQQGDNWQFLLPDGKCLKGNAPFVTAIDVPGADPAWGTELASWPCRQTNASTLRAHPALDAGELLEIAFLEGYTKASGFMLNQDEDFFILEKQDGSKAIIYTLLSATGYSGCLLGQENIPSSPPAEAIAIARAPEKKT